MSPLAVNILFIVIHGIAVLMGVSSIWGALDMLRTKSATFTKRHNPFPFGYDQVTETGTRIYPIGIGYLLSGILIAVPAIDNLVKAEYVIGEYLVIFFIVFVIQMFSFAVARDMKVEEN